MVRLRMMSNRHYLFVAFFLAVIPLTSATAMGRSPDQSVLLIETGTGSHEFSVEVADTDALRQRGLMYRQDMADDHGMIFILQQPRQVNFTMRNTYISLDMIFVGEDGTIGSIIQNTPTLQKGPFPSQGVVAAVVELNAGMTAKLGIKPGDRVLHSRLDAAGQ